MVPGLYLHGFLTPPAAGVSFLAALGANCFLGAFSLPSSAGCFFNHFLSPGSRTIGPPFAALDHTDSMYTLWLCAL